MIPLKIRATKAPAPPITAVIGIDLLAMGRGELELGVAFVIALVTVPTSVSFCVLVAG